jgi:peptidoglycan/xylan/chitin deacetylase (PgdA/CDA1 family)
MPNFRLDRFLTISFFQPLLHMKGPTDDKKIPILMYHSISDEKETASHPYYHINTSPTVFAEQMRFLSDNDYSVIDLKDLKDCFEKNNQLTRKFAVLTFDDGYRDFYTSAFPTLKKYHFPATVFLSTDFIDEDRKTFKGKECLVWGEVQELHDNGISFGSHTVNHPELYRLPREKVRKELRDSKLQIESILNMQIFSFCYPYAFPQEDRDFVRRFKQELIEQGYRIAVTTIIGRAGCESDLLTLPRLPVNQSDDEKLFEAKLLGAYDWIAGAQALVKSIKFHLRSVVPNRSSGLIN